MRTEYKSEKPTIKHLFVAVIIALCAVATVAQDATFSPGEYQAKEITISIDGKLDEWSACSRIPLNQIKDADSGSCSTNDFSGNAMMAWNRTDPSRMYFALEVTDDVFQTTQPESQWWFNDTADMVNMMRNASDTVSPMVARTT